MFTAYRFGLALVLGTGILAPMAIPNCNRAQDANQESKAGDTVSGQDQQLKQDNGQQDLNQAFEKKIAARTGRDLDEVVRLCKSAIEKGLTDDETAQARELMVSALLEQAQELAARIFAPQPATQWRSFRGRAIRLLDQLIEVDGTKLDAHLLQARLQILPGGDMKLARAAAEKAVELAASRPKQLAEALIVRAATSGDDREKQLADLTQAVKIDPDNVAAKRARGGLLLDMNQPDKAASDLEAWLITEPNNIGAWILAIQAMEQRGESALAMQFLDKAIENNPDQGLLFGLRARLRISQENEDGALEDALKAAELDAKNKDAWIVQATVYAQQEKLDEALVAVNKALELDAFDGNAKWLRSLIYAQQENFTEALRDLRWLDENTEGLESIRLQLAAVLNANKDPRAAIKVYEEILGETAENSQALRGRGDAWLSLGAHKEALADYEAALKLVPEDSGLLNNLAWLLATSTFDDLRDGKRSIELATKACESTKYEAAHILSTLASGYAEIGDFVTARKWAKDAVEKAESDEQKKGLQEELDSYLAEKPWRELDNVEAEKADKKDDKAGDDKAGDDKAGDDKAGDDKAGDDKAGDDKAGDDKAGDDKAGDDKAGGDKAGGGGNGG